MAVPSHGWHPLTTPAERPARVGGEPPWIVAGTRDIGELHIPDGRFVIDDLLEPSPRPFVLDTGASVVSGRLVIATHPRFAPATAALDIAFVPDAGVGGWEFLPVGETGDEGLVCGYGVAGIGAATALAKDPDIFEDIDERIIGHDARGHRFGFGADGDLFGFWVPGQHAPCRVFLGRAPSGRPVRLVIDLDLIRTAPDVDGHLPWEPDAATGTAPERWSALGSRATASGTVAFIAGDRARRGTPVATAPAASGQETSTPRGQAHWEAARAHSDASLHHARLALAAERTGDGPAARNARRSARRHHVVANEHHRAWRADAATAAGHEPGPGGNSVLS